MKSTEPTKPKRVTFKLIKIESQGDGYYRYIIIIRNGNHKKPLYIGLKAIDEMEAFARYPKLEQLLKAYYLANDDIYSNVVLADINRLCFP